uniref:Uncharacterized protein n=1 Tax=Rhizophora mucronata TaxID=61149 RepID=A0A2P2LYM8_RHIMU
MLWLVAYRSMLLRPWIRSFFSFFVFKWPSNRSLVIYVNKGSLFQL